MKNWRGLFFAVLLCAFSAALYGQEFTGHVTDASGAVVPRAKITVKNLNTDVQNVTYTTDSGDYTVPYLKPGKYSVTVETAGFATEQKTNIELQVGQTATIDFVLKIGAATETVNVSSEALLNISKADRGEVIENTRVTELPLNGRDPGMLSILVAGASWTGSPQWQRPFDDTQANLAVNGGQPGNVALLMDGITNSSTPINNSGQSQISFVAPVDSVQEFKILTNPYDAQYGLMAGAVEDVVLKSGTNTLHGDVYEYARRTWLDANTWSNDYYIGMHRNDPNFDTTPFRTPKMKWDQYGAELDGPVYLPKIYDGRNKSFFTLQYENWHELEPNTITDSVPSPQWADGDFTNLVYWNGNDQKYEPITLYDPLNIHQDANGTWKRVPFGPSDTINPTPAPNMVPASRINPMAQKIIKMYPAPNTTPPTGSNPFANNYVVAGADEDRYRNALGKWDQNISSKDRMTLSYGYWERVEVRSYDGFTTPGTRGQLPHGERSHTFTLTETHTFTPNLLFDFRARVGVRADYSYNGPRYDPTNLGWSAQQVAAMGPAALSQFPYLNISEFNALGTDSNGQSVKNSLSLLPSVTWIKGKHTIHAGLDARFWQIGYNVIGGGNNFWIDRTWTQYNCGSCGSWDPASGNSIASLLLGNPTSGSDTIGVKTYWTSHYWAPFFQDDWKLTRKLTLNLGLRWDFVEPATERHNYSNGGFDATAVNPISSQVTVPGYSQILGSVTFLGVNDYPRTPYPLSKWDIQPRVGVAYALNDKTVLSAGFGESTRTPQNAPNNIGYSAQTSYQANDPNWPGATHPNLANQIDNPYTTIIQPTGSKLGALTALGTGPWTINPKYIIPTFWNYSVGVERQLSKNTVINLAYVGSRLYNGDCNNNTFHGSCPNINHVSADAMTNCNPENGGRYENCDNNNVPNPFKGVSAFQGTSYYSSSTINFLNLTRPFPEFTDMTMWQANTAHTWYNSLQLTGTHRMNALTLHGTWTWSKMMDEGGVLDTTYMTPFRQIDGGDITHRITISGVYMLPVGRGRLLLSHTNRILDTALGGWELGGLYVYQSGNPWLLPGNPSEIYLRSAWVKPHIQKDNGFIRLVASCVEQWQEQNGVYSIVKLQSYDYDGSCAQGSAFRQVPRYAPVPNNIDTGIRHLANHQTDVNLSKNFALYERLNLQLRIEAFNVFNHPLWSMDPDDSTNDSTFGLIQRGPTGQSNLPRQMQLSARIRW
jgi:hypothetical protein